MQNKDGPKFNTVWGSVEQKSRSIDIMEEVKKLLKLLKNEGTDQIGELQKFKLRKLVQILNPELHKMERWEPNKQFLINYTKKSVYNAEIKLFCK